MELRACLSGLGLAMVSLALGCSPRPASGKAPATPASTGAAPVTIADEAALASSSADEIPSTREAEDSPDEAVGTTTLTSTTLPLTHKLLLPAALWQHWDEEPLPPPQTWGVSPSAEELAEIWGY